MLPQAGEPKQESEVSENLGIWELGGQSVHWESKPQRRRVHAREAAQSRKRGEYSGFSLPPGQTFSEATGKAAWEMQFT